MFTTLQKFRPGEDGDRNPGAHRPAQRRRGRRRSPPPQYGFSDTLDSGGRIKTGLAQHLRDALPGATFLGFTGTPIESTDKSTRAVFGDYIDIYDLTCAVEDGATVKIFYESRRPRWNFSAADYAALDAAADEITENVEELKPPKPKSRWSRLRLPSAPRSA